MKNAILINPDKQSVTLVKVGRESDIYFHLGANCTIFNPFIFFDNNDVLYVDDDALDRATQGSFMLEAYGYFLSGNGLIVGADADGEYADCQATIEDIKAQIVWVSKEDAQNWSDEAQNTPFTFISL